MYIYIYLFWRYFNRYLFEKSIKRLKIYVHLLKNRTFTFNRFVPKICRHFQTFYVNEDNTWTISNTHVKLVGVFNGYTVIQAEIKPCV